MSSRCLPSTPDLSMSAVRTDSRAVNMIPRQAVARVASHGATGKAVFGTNGPARVHENRDIAQLAPINDGLEKARYHAMRAMAETFMSFPAGSWT